MPWPLPSTTRGDVKPGRRRDPAPINCPKYASAEQWYQVFCRQVASFAAFLSSRDLLPPGADRRESRTRNGSITVQMPSGYSAELSHKHG